MARAHAHTNTHTHDGGNKMADDVNQDIEEALNTIVNLTDQSGNLTKELKKSIHETVSTLRSLIFILKDNLKERVSENCQLQTEVKQRTN